MKKILLFLLWLPSALFAQSKEETIRKIYDEQLSNSPAYENLRYLCKEIGNRITGSPGAAKAVDFTAALMRQYQFDTVYLQPIMVPHWVRGEKEVVNMKIKGQKPVALHALALGHTRGTGSGTVEGEVTEVQSLDELKALGEAGVKGKIVFFNRPMKQTLVDPLHAYGEAGDQRNYGPSEAAKLGASGVLVRSLAINTDHTPHTGYTYIDPDGKSIPALAISTKDADMLSAAVKSKKKPAVSIRYNSGVKEMVQSYNVIGELKGMEFPEEIIAVGGHLDSWDVGEGAHDDGGGCMQAIEVGRTFKKLGISPKRTIRVVMWMDEEYDGTGNIKYAEEAKAKGENHIAALESDIGVFTPLGFRFETEDPKAWEQINSWKPYFEPYNIHYFKEGHGGVDISPLGEQGALLIGYQPDTQRYFKLHHTVEDTFEKVDKRELNLGAAAITGLIYLIDQEGIIK